MKSIKFKNSEWFYNSEEDLLMLSLLAILDKIYKELNKLKSNELFKESNIFKSNYVVTKVESSALLQHEIVKFNNLSRTVFKNTSKPPFISTENTLKTLQVTYVK